MANPVGVTIAMRQKQQGNRAGSETMKPSPSKLPKHLDSPQQTPKQPSSWQVLLEGSAMYLCCLILPSLLGYLYQLYLNEFQEPKATTSAANVEQSSHSFSNAAYSYGSYYYQSFMSSVCPDPMDVDPNSYTAYVCPGIELEQARYAPLYSQDTAWSDVTLISLLSLLLAVCRGLLVHYLVPRDYESIEALLRCKSSHLLSSDYSIDRNNNNNTGKHEFAAANEPYDWDDDDVGMRFDESERELMPPKIENESSCQAPQVVLLSHPDLYSAPRFATAVFRLFYTACAVILAFYSFHHANFWPWFVLGSGSTKNCWDLNGGLTLGIDEDYDHCNTTLRRYFLFQASYHWHSGAFHVWSIAMLLKNPHSAPRRFLSMQSSSANYLGSMVQHVLLLVAIGAAYIFSSLRRLGAIGMFAFDVSSCFLHLLQICTNAPENSRWRRSEVVWRVYFLLVLPSYVVTRLVIWPLLWYSATFESEKWLRQFEQTLVPGSARILKGVMHVLMSLLMLMTLVHFKRLCKHSHVQRALQKID
ncbi:hypothetical protein MPSEU_000459000 [Mayamaea pseudoterrestris]|nr:hypothetical protein MPSEU_000459000 [Mayamaea pseudoterrestris]